MKNRFLRQLILGLSVCSIMLVNTKVVDASPWASPDDLLFRHDLQILVDSGALNIPISTWPLAWGDIAYNLTKNESEMSLIEITSFQRIKEALIEAEMGGLGGQTEIKVAKNPNQMTWFNDSVTNTKSVGAQSSYLSKNLALNIKVEKIPGKTLMDESYLAIARGNYSLTLGSKKNWWGPGWDSSLVLSSNARPIRGLSIERNFSDPFESAFLKWIGPWDLSVIIGELDSNRSISDPIYFIKNNINSSTNLFFSYKEYYKVKKIKLFHISTDEVFGSKKYGKCKENDAYEPSSPYSASKGSSDLIARAFNKTYNTEIKVLNLTNNYGPYQFPEKFIPTLIFHFLKNRRAPIYGKGLNVSKNTQAGRIVK